MTGKLSVALAMAVLCVCEARVIGDENARRDAATAALKKAAACFRDHVAVHGGYVYYYSLDLKERLGEGIAGPKEIWVQPPGTPSVGMAFLDAYRATGDRYYLDAATEAAQALMYGQLESGGWTYSIDFDPQGKRVAKYRSGKGRGRNYSTLDDDTTQAAIRFLMAADKAHEFKHAAIHDSVGIALDALLQAQFPSGGFPQGWQAPANSSAPVRKASFPTYDWRSEGRIKNYWDMPTLNDGLAGTVAETLIAAHAIYGELKYKEALVRLGDFLILAQMPDPQPAWSQQYSEDMHPIWARRFEPAAITGGESQDVLRTLLVIHRATGEKRFLEPLPRALAYLKRSQLTDGRLARYYELKTNRPLYMQRQGDVYSLTYDDRDLPTHYAWKVASRLEAIEREYDDVVNGRERAKRPRTRAALQGYVDRVVKELDAEGRWVSGASGARLTGQPKFAWGDKYLSSDTFCKNVAVLCDYLTAE